MRRFTIPMFTVALLLMIGAPGVSAATVELPPPDVASLPEIVPPPDLLPTVECTNETGNSEFCGLAMFDDDGDYCFLEAEIIVLQPVVIVVGDVAIVLLVGDVYCDFGDCGLWKLVPAGQNQ